METSQKPHHGTSSIRSIVISIASLVAACLSGCGGDGNPASQSAAENSADRPTAAAPDAGTVCRTDGAACASPSGSSNAAAQPIGPGRCLAYGQACLVAGDCCSGTCLYGACRASQCNSNGHVCVSPSDCCSTHCAAGVCSETSSWCLDPGATCTSYTDCCSLTCAAGQCADTTTNSTTSGSGGGSGSGDVNGPSDDAGNGGPQSGRAGGDGGA
jgi:hypothetical protein